MEQRLLTGVFVSFQTALTTFLVFIVYFYVMQLAVRSKPAGCILPAHKSTFWPRSIKIVYILLAFGPRLLHGCKLQNKHTRWTRTLELSKRFKAGDQSRSHRDLNSDH